MLLYYSDVRLQIILVMEWIGVKSKIHQLSLALSTEDAVKNVGTHCSDWPRKYTQVPSANYYVICMQSVVFLCFK